MFKFKSIFNPTIKLSKATTLDSMFLKCKSLTNIDVSKFVTTNVKNMNSVFMVCESLTSIDVSKFDTSKVTEMNYMFSDCLKLTSLNLVTFNTDVCQSFSGIFNNDQNLRVDVNQNTYNKLKEVIPNYITSNNWLMIFKYYNEIIFITLKIK